MQAIARVNRTYKGKDCGYVVDYHGLADHLTDALEMFSSDDVEGTFHTLKEEIPHLEATHTRVMSFFKQVKSDDVDDWVLALKDEEIRTQFDIAFKSFTKQMNIVMPNKAAKPFLANLKQLGKVNNACRLKYRDEQMDLSEAGAKVRDLVNEHILSTGVDPKIPPVDLLAADFTTKLDEFKSSESKASEVESAIKHHISINLDEDPEYYKSLALKLEDIIQKNAGKWDEQLQLLLDLRVNIESDRQQAANDLGLSETELSFYNILMAEVTRNGDDETLSEETHEQIKTMTQELVALFDEATQIVDFFNKEDEKKRMKKNIKHAALDQPFGDKKLVAVLQDRFMDLAETKFGKKK